MRLKGKTALVTAAAAGIGRAVAEAFHAEGATVHAVDLDGAGLATLEGVNAHAIDLLDLAALAQLAAATGPVDILFNGAGMVAVGSVLECSEEDWERSFALNATTMFRLIKLYLPGMIAAGGGSIVNVASVASSLIGVPNRFAYGASKAAIIGLTKAVAADFVAQGIRCNAICPGTVESPSLLARVHAHAEAAGISFEESHAQFSARQPVGRLGQVSEIAALAVHLASDESRFTTGTTAVIDGGWTVM